MKLSWLSELKIDHGEVINQMQQIEISVFL